MVIDVIFIFNAQALHHLVTYSISTIMYLLYHQVSGLIRLIKSKFQYINKASEDIDYKATYSIYTNPSLVI